MTQDEPEGARAHAGGLQEWFFAGVVLSVLVFTRLPLAPKYLYYFDSVNFALALENFDPSKHQPQPPGYPLFVGFTRLLHLFLPQPEHVLLAAGLLGALAAVLLIRRLTTEMFDGNAGILACALLIVNPSFWFGGVTNQVRLCLAFCSTGVALLAWRALRHPDRSRWLYVTFAALAVTAGFRPTLGVLLFPLVLWSWWKAGASLRRLLTGLLVLIISSAPWMIATIVAVGGIDNWFRLMWSYSNEQFRGTSVVFGASIGSAWRMATWSVIWNGIGTLAWIWAVPFVRAPWKDRDWREKATFLTIWFLPIFLFSLLIHIGDPDQALASIPVLCIAGGAVLASFLARTNPVRLTDRRFQVTAVGVAAVNAYLFFYPPRGPARASGYNAVVSVDYRTRSVIDAIKELRRDGPLTILHYQGIVTWRQLAYYFPDDYVVYLPPNPGDPSWTSLNRETAFAGLPSTELLGTKRLVLVDPQTDAAILLEEGWKQHGAVYYLDAAASTEVQVGPHRLTRLQKSSLPATIQ